MPVFRTKEEAFQWCDAEGSSIINDANTLAGFIKKFQKIYK
jgi:hypothetical protein